MVIDLHPSWQIYGVLPGKSEEKRTAFVWPDLLLVVNIKEIIVIYIVVIWLNIDRAGARLLSQIGSISSGLEGSRFGH